MTWLYAATALLTLAGLLGILYAIAVTVLQRLHGRARRQA